MTAETIDGVSRVVSEEPAEERALAVVPERQAHLSSGLGAIAAMSDDAFERNLALLTKAKVRATQMQKALLTEGVDYGTVPGIPRPFLHKPGAETFEKAYGFATSYEVERKVGDGAKTPELEYIVHAKVHLGDTDGPIVGEGLGSCNTHESKYRFRAAKKSCPACHNEGLIKGKPDGKLKGAYWCPQDKGGCNARFAPGSPEFEAIENQQTGQVENENPWDLANTILKMARKRAGVDGILTATGTSGIFTQDDDSPSVQREASGTQAAAATTTKPAGAGGGGLPAMPRDLAERTSLGIHTITATATVATSGPNDGQLRQGPDGPVLGFRLELPGGAKVNRVFALGPVAAQLAEATKGNPSALAGQTVTATGELFGVPWTKKNDEGVEEQMPPFRELTVTALVWGDLHLPAAEAAEAKPKGKPPKQTTVADAAHEASKAPGPGMTVEALGKVLDAGRIAHSYAANEAQERFSATGKTPDEILAGITDPQRLELAAALGLLADEEN